MATFDTTNDTSATYAQKQLLLSALRQRQQQLANTPSMSNTISTAASGAYPGSTQVNYGGILANAVKAFQQAKVNKEADAAAQKVADTRSKAIDELTPNNLEKITPAQAVKLQEMGIDVGQLKAFQPKAEPIANLMQHLGEFNEEDAPMLAKMYGQDEGQIRTMISAAAKNRQAAEDRKFQQEKALKLLGLRETKPTDFEQYQENPEAYAQFAKLKGSASDPYTKALAMSQAKADVSTIQGLPQLDVTAKMLSDMQAKDLQDEAAHKPEPFLSGGKLKVLSAMGQQVGLTGENDLSTVPQEANLLAQKANTLALQASDVFKGQGSVTENERAILAKTKVMPTDTRSQRLAKYQIMNDAIASGQQKMKEAIGRVQSHAPNLAPGVPAAAPGQWSVRVKQ